MTCSKSHLCRRGWCDIRHWGEGETPCVGALHQQLIGCLLKITLRPRLRNCVQVTGQAAAPLPGHGPSHEGNASFLHASATLERVLHRGGGGVECVWGWGWDGGGVGVGWGWGGGGVGVADWGGGVWD